MRAFSSAVSALALALTLPGIAGAQSLSRVTVTAFTLSADTARPRVNVPFHLVVTLRLRERVRDVENVQLPLLVGLQMLGDVRSASTGARGTLYRETLTVAARHAGVLAIAPATYDAVDARTGKAEEYSTNALSLNVAGTPGSSRAAFIVGEVLVSLGVAMMVLGFALAIVLRRRKAPPPKPAEPAPAPPPRVRADPLRDALASLEARPDRTGAVDAREIVWRMVGASDGETLADVSERVRAEHPELIPVLAALERAAFTYDDDVPQGVAQAIAALRAIR